MRTCRIAFDVRVLNVGYEETRVESLEKVYQPRAVRAQAVAALGLIDRLALVPELLPASPRLQAPSSFARIRSHISPESPWRRPLPCRCKPTSRTTPAPDVLVNNAAIMPMGAVTDTTQDDWDRVMAVNVRGIFHCSRHVISEMKKGRHGGSIINLGSVTAIVGTPGIAAYTASKGAVVALTRQMAIDYAADAIRVNSVSPGTVDTPMLARAVAAGRRSSKGASGV